MTKRMMTLTKLAWMSDDEFRDMVESVPKFKEWSLKFSGHPLMKAFARDKAISYVFHSNKFENTLPLGVKHGDTYKMLAAPQDPVPFGRATGVGHKVQVQRKFVSL